MGLVFYTIGMIFLVPALSDLVRLIIKMRKTGEGNVPWEMFAKIAFGTTLSVIGLILVI